MVTTGQRGGGPGSGEGSQRGGSQGTAPGRREEKSPQVTDWDLKLEEVTGWDDPPLSSSVCPLPPCPGAFLQLCCPPVVPWKNPPLSGLSLFQTLPSAGSPQPSSVRVRCVDRCLPTPRVLGLPCSFTGYSSLPLSLCFHF